MAIDLSDYDRALLEGKYGSAKRMAMSIMTRMVEVYGAGRLMDISSAHIDSTIYIGDTTLEFAERLASLSARVVVPTTLNVSGVDEHGWHEWDVPSEWAEKSHRQMVAYQSMGCVPTWTCAPYQTKHRPRFGQQIAWGESNAIAFANSIVGARTERYPDLLDICAAITGRVPAFGLHLTENRAGQMLVRLVDVPPSVQQEEIFFPLLGYLLGKVAQDQIPVVEGMETIPSEDQLKALCAAAASTGAVGLFHIVGITPEAPTIEAAFQGYQPQQVIAITMDDLRAAYRDLNTVEDESLNMVVIGCPHLSLSEFAKVVKLIEGKTRHPDVQFLVTTNREVKDQAMEAGFLSSLDKFGGAMTLDTCILATPMLPSEIKVLMTNSAKCAYYTPGLLDKKVVFGSLKDCVRAAVTGRVEREEQLWD
jgi:predicted aconitase